MFGKILNKLSAWQRLELAQLGMPKQPQAHLTAINVLQIMSGGMFQRQNVLLKQELAIQDMSKLL